MTPDAEDVINEVTDRLAVLTDLFNFYETIEMHNLIAGFRKQTFNGLITIIDDCIDKLKKIEKKPEQLRMPNNNHG
jgi:hypothetical protein